VCNHVKQLGEYNYTGITTSPIDLS